MQVTKEDVQKEVKKGGDRGKLDLPTKLEPRFCEPWLTDPCLDGRNRAIVIAESLARVIAAIRIASVRWQSYLPPKHRN